MIVATALTSLAAPYSPRYVALTALVALIAGGMLLVARLLRLGFLADFLSRTVLVGFLTGVGVQVALGQLHGMLGLEKGGDSAGGCAIAAAARATRLSAPYSSPGAASR